MTPAFLLADDTEEDVFSICPPPPFGILLEDPEDETDEDDSFICPPPPDFRLEDEHVQQDIPALELPPAFQGKHKLYRCTQISQHVIIVVESEKSGDSIQ